MDGDPWGDLLFGLVVAAGFVVLCLIVLNGSA